MEKERGKRTDAPRLTIVAEVLVAVEGLVDVGVQAELLESAAKGVVNEKEVPLDGGRERRNKGSAMRRGRDATEGNKLTFAMGWKASWKMIITSLFPEMTVSLERTVL